MGDQRPFTAMGLGAWDDAGARERGDAAQQRICTVALAYPRGELPFIEEWLEYHLALGVDHIFLALHVNEDLVPIHNYVTVRRPYAAMYELEATETEVVDQFLAKVRPFRPHVTTYLLHRSFETEPDGHRSAQRHLYNAVLGMQRDAYDWMCPHDIDEYLVPQPPFETIRDALADCPDRYSAVVMEQVIVLPRWDDTWSPRPTPLLIPDLPRCSEIVPLDQLHHGVKTFVRPSDTVRLDLHLPEMAIGSHALFDRRLLQYHFHGFMADIDAAPVRPLDLEVAEFDVTDDRPWRVLQQARRTGRGQAPRPA